MAAAIGICRRLIFVSGGSTTTTFSCLARKTTTAGAAGGATTRSVSACLSARMNGSSSTCQLHSCRAVVPFTRLQQVLSYRTTTGMTTTNTTAAAAMEAGVHGIIQEPTLTQPSLISTTDGRQFAAIEFPKQHKKLKPYIVKRRLKRLHTYEGREKGIRHSFRRMNLVCQLAARLPLEEALVQLDFCHKRMAPLVHKVLKRTANLASIRHGLQHSQLEVAECFATRGSHIKRLKIHARGKSGIMRHRHSHIRVVLREIDFKLKIIQAKTMHQKKRWVQRQYKAEQDAARQKQEQDEIDRLQREADAKAQQKRD